MSASRGFEWTEAVTSDLAFVARGATLEEAFAAAADALLAATLDEPAALQLRVEHPLRLEEPDPELLLLAFLNELVFLRDARGWLLRAGRLRIATAPGSARIEGSVVGEPIDPARHRLATEVKAATAHGLRVARWGDGWEAHVTLDV
jgi:SHS2 domain-containing protein